MRMSLRTAWSLVVLGAFVGCAEGLAPRVSIPPEHRRSRPDASDPTGEAPAARYRHGYESFWWNCLAVKAVDSEARCPDV